MGCATDKKCPFTGLVSIRGRILTGTVVSTKMHRTLVIRREYLHFVPKYSRYEKRHMNLSAHVSPAFRVEEGDQVTVGQCRPISKTVCHHYFSGEGMNGMMSANMRCSVLGALQCAPRAAQDRQAGQAVQQVLDAMRRMDKCEHVVKGRGQVDACLAAFRWAKEAGRKERPGGFLLAMSAH